MLPPPRSPEKSKLVFPLAEQAARSRQEAARAEAKAVAADDWVPEVSIRLGGGVEGKSSLSGPRLECELSSPEHCEDPKAGLDDRRPRERLGSRRQAVPRFKRAYRTSPSDTQKIVEARLRKRNDQTDLYKSLTQPVRKSNVGEN